MEVVHPAHRLELPRERLGVDGQRRDDLRAREVPQLGQGAALDDPPRAHDAHVIAEGLDLGEDVARQQDGPPVRSLGAQVLGEDALHERVEPRRRLVEEEELDVGGERRDERDFLPVALGVGAPLLRRVEGEALDEVVPPVGVEAAARPAEEVDRLPAREIRPQIDVTGHVGEAAVQGRSLRPGVAAEESRRAGVGPQEPEEHADRRRLA